MSLHYILDGYNVLNKIFPAHLGKLVEAREALIRVIEVQRPQGSVRNSVMIVFDGQPGLGLGASDKPVRVVFTQGESADELIKNMVLRATNPKKIVVVTEDREICSYVTSIGAGVLKVRDFFKGSSKCQRSRLGQARKVMPGEASRVSKSVEYQINAELEKIWIKGSR